MIMTDGEITDFDKTVEQIVIGSDLPLSIIIVGVVGIDDFLHCLNKFINFDKNIQIWGFLKGSYLGEQNKKENAIFYQSYFI